MSWTAEKVNLLKQLWSDGLSAGEIAKNLGDVSRNAVIGKAHRLGLESRPSPIKRKVTPLTIPSSKAVTKVAPGASEGKKRLNAIKNNIVPLKGHACQWPIGDPRDAAFRFCDDRALPGKPYCSDHASQAYQNYRPEDKKQKKRA